MRAQCAEGGREPDSSRVPVHDNGSSRKGSDYRRGHRCASPPDGTSVRCLYPQRPRTARSVGRYTDGCRIDFECPGSVVGKPRPGAVRKDSKQLTFGFSSDIYLAGKTRGVIRIGRLINGPLCTARAKKKDLSMENNILKKVVETSYFCPAFSFKCSEGALIGSVVT